MIEQALKAEEAAFKRQLDQATERFDVGLSDKTDVLEAQAQLDGAVANRISARAGYTELRHELELYGICPACRRAQGRTPPANKLPVSV